MNYHLTQTGSVYIYSALSAVLQGVAILDTGEAVRELGTRIFMHCQIWETLFDFLRYLRLSAHTKLMELLGEPGEPFRRMALSAPSKAPQWNHEWLPNLARLITEQWLLLWSQKWLLQFYVCVYIFE